MQLGIFMEGTSKVIYCSVYANTLVIKSAVSCLQRQKIYYAELCRRVCKRVCVGRVSGCDIFRLAITIKILRHCYSICNASLYYFFKVQTMSDLVGDCERQKVADNLRISSPAQRYCSREDVDDSQIVLSVEIPYYLLNEWHGKVDKSDPSSKRSQLHHS